MKLVILGRLGVVEEQLGGAGTVRTLPGSLEAIARLNHAGYRVVIACNEAGLHDGTLNLDGLGAIHNRLHQQLAKVGAHLDGLFFCSHGPGVECDCRKPRPGLYLEIGQRFSTALEGVPIVGDSLLDLAPAAAVGALPMLVLTGNGGAERAAILRELPGTAVYPDLAAVASALVRESPA